MLRLPCPPQYPCQIRRDSLNHRFSNGLRTSPQRTCPYGQVVFSARYRVKPIALLSTGTYSPPAYQGCPAESPRCSFRGLTSHFRDVRGGVSVRRRLARTTQVEFSKFP